MKHRHFKLAVATALGSLLLTAPAAIADDTIVYTPDFSTFDAYQAESIPPIYEDVTGSEQWNITDVSTGTTTPDALTGNDTVITFLSYSSNDFIVTGGAQDGLLQGAEIDYLNLGLGFANEWVSSPADLPGALSPTITDLFITPFGDFSI